MQFRFFLAAVLLAVPGAAQQAFTEVDGLLSVEAEHFSGRQPSTFPQYTQVHTWEPVLGRGGSGDGYMESVPDERGEDGVGPGVPEGTDGARLDYPIWINQPGRYFIWVRGRSRGGESNGLHVGIDGSLGGGQAISGFFPQNQWTWESRRRIGSAASVQILQPGPHTLNAWNRDDGFKLDKIVLTTDLAFLPTGTGPEESLMNVGSLVISPAVLPGATELQPYEVQLTTDSGSAPLSWRIEGTPPPGLTIDGPTGVLSGTPTERGTYAFVVRVDDSGGETGSRVYELTVLAAPLQIVSQSPAPPATLGQSYSFQIEVIGGEPPYTYFQLRTYPPGLSLSNATGLVSGVLTEAGQFAFAVLVNDSKNGFADRTFALTVVGEPLSITTPPRLANAAVGGNYAVALTASGGAPPYAWEAVSALPEGFALTPDGMLTAAPTRFLGEVTFTLAVTDAVGQAAQRQFALAVLAPLTSVTAAGFHEGPVAPVSIVSGFGLNIAPGIAGADERPLPTELLGRRIDVIDSSGARRPARLFFLSPEQVNFLMPTFLFAGPGVVEILDEDDAIVASGPIEIQPVAPQLFVSTPDGIVAGFGLRVLADGTQVVEELVELLSDGTLGPKPLRALEEGEQRFLVVFGTGLRGYDDPPTATFDGVAIPVVAAQAQGEFDGLDQVNLGPFSLLPGVTTGELILEFAEGPTEPVFVPLAP